MTDLLIISKLPKIKTPEDSTNLRAFILFRHFLGAVLCWLRYMYRPIRHA